MRHSTRTTLRRARGPLGAVTAAALLVALVGCSVPPEDVAASPAAATAAGSTPTAASPTPPASLATQAPVVVEELGKGGQDAAVDVEVTGPVQVAYRRITIEPGAGTGLHCHDGQLVAVVEQGTLTHYAPVYPGGVHEYLAGDSIVEGAHYVHEGKNEGTEDVVLLVTYVIAEGSPLAETDLSHCDPQ
ncbi:cupin domain-containing protein [Herbiconiux sp. A18JL235]|uniref:Cupin domain-containing protein n=1 Tax=Herbiconiux sp. A18JL235 TaxID=3152363 RepID=A0AB39BC67_9MICO